MSQNTYKDVVKQGSFPPEACGLEGLGWSYDMLDDEFYLDVEEQT